ncbi:MAG: ribonuclease P protein component [Dysgonamonadaceae bacterium]|jgi:ribonuclease P protein component|nr:ribonuclease P protein component [Dysgonamonadaceae bacterium]
METKKYGLPKKERVSSKKEIDLLFTQGDSFIAYPLRVVYIARDCEEISDESVVSIMVSVSKKKFKRAVKRNRIKRLVKESYRLNKRDFIGKITSLHKCVSISFLYLSDEEKSYIEIESAVCKALETLSTKIQPNEND